VAIKAKEERMKVEFGRHVIEKKKLQEKVREKENEIGKMEAKGRQVEWMGMIWHMVLGMLLFNAVMLSARFFLR